MTIYAQPDSRLDQLAAMYDRLKAEAETATEAFETVKAALKAEMASRAEGQASVDLSSDYLAKPLRLHWKPTTRLDAKRLKAEAPMIYADFVKRDGHWELRQVTE